MTFKLVPPELTQAERIRGRVALSAAVRACREGRSQGMLSEEYAEARRKWITAIHLFGHRIVRTDEELS